MTNRLRRHDKDRQDEGNQVVEAAQTSHVAAVAGVPQPHIRIKMEGRDQLLLERVHH